MAYISAVPWNQDSELEFLELAGAITSQPQRSAEQEAAREAFMNRVFPVLLRFAEADATVDGETANELIVDTFSALEVRNFHSLRRFFELKAIRPKMTLRRWVLRAYERRRAGFKRRIARTLFLDDERLTAIPARSTVGSEKLIRAFERARRDKLYQDALATLSPDQREQISYYWDTIDTLDPTLGRQAAIRSAKAAFAEKFPVPPGEVDRRLHALRQKLLRAISREVEREP